jgi:hypothetical protein
MWLNSDVTPVNFAVKFCFCFSMPDEIADEKQFKNSFKMLK